MLFRVFYRIGHQTLVQCTKSLVPNNFPKCINHSSIFKWGFAFSISSYNRSSIVPTVVCILQRMTSRGYVTVCPKVLAAAPQARRVVTLLLGRVVSSYGILANVSECLLSVKSISEKKHSHRLATKILFCGSETKLFNIMAAFRQDVLLYCGQIAVELFIFLSLTH